MITTIQSFQSTLPRRERPTCLILIPRFVPFQSTLPRRERRMNFIKAVVNLIFKSTLPRRERRPYIRDKITEKDLNPRSREGSDQAATIYGIIFDKFKSTLPRRERHMRGYSSSTVTLFKSTLPRRERRVMTIQL